MSRLRRVNPLYAAAAALAIVTLIFTALTTGQGGTVAGRTASVYDDGPGGAAALRHAIDAIGGTTSALEGDTFSIDAGRVGILFMLGATELVTPADVATVRAFLRAGGTVVVASDLGLLERPLLDAFHIGYRGPAAPGAHALASAAFTNPPARRIAFDGGTTLSTGDEALALADDGGAPIVALAHDGPGALVVVGSLWPFLAQGLGDADNGRFAIALAAQALGSRREVAFDEYHHGLHPSADVLVLIERTWPGRALVFVAAVTFVYLVLSGRPFGSPVPLDPRPPRSSLEYVRGFAGLVRRSGRGEIARRRLRRELHSALARASGLDPATPFDRTLAAVAAGDPARAARARAADEALGRPLRDDALLRTVREIQELGGLRPASGGSAPGTDDARA